MQWKTISFFKKEFDAVLAKRIKLEKFRWHNSQWVEMIESQHDVAADHDDLYDDDVLSPYLQEGNLLYEPSKSLSGRC